MAVATLEYAYERIYEVLVDGDGTGRTLAAADRFSRGHPPGFDPKLRAVRAKVNPAVFVVIGAAAVDGFAAGEMSDEHLYRLKVAIYRDHWLGYQGDPEEVEGQLVAATDAFFKVRAALCFPGNLQQTEAANATGLAGYALNGAQASTRLESVSNLGGNNRLLHYRDNFDAALEWNPDA